jgi:hypothetical protein
VLISGEVGVASQAPLSAIPFALTHNAARSMRMFAQ